MATRTWRGTTSSDWNVASNWLEGAVPLNGDDVVFDSQSRNCQLTSNVPSTGQLRSFVVANDYTGTINFGNYILYVGQGAYAGVIFNSGTSATYQCGTGGVQLYSSSTTSSGINVVYGNNQSLSNVNFFLNCNGLGRYIDIQTNFFCKRLKILAHSIYLSARAININIYDGIEDYGTYNNSNISLLTNPTTKVYLHGGYINLYNSLQCCDSLIIVNPVSLMYHLNLYMTNYNNSTTCGLYYDTNGNIECNGYNLIYYPAGYNFNHMLYLDKAIDNLIIVNAYQYASTLRILTDLTVSNYFSIIETPRPRSPYNAVRSGTNGTKVNITLGNNCKYLIAWSLLYDLSFNKPVTAFKSTISNCDNIKVVDYPVILKNTF